MEGRPVEGAIPCSEAAGHRDGASFSLRLPLLLTREQAGTGEYDRHYPTDGVYACAGCGTPLYKAEHKFKSGCGWPAYHSSIPGALASSPLWVSSKTNVRTGAIERHEDVSFGMKRIEIVCKACGGHLGAIPYTLWLRVRF